MNKIEEIRSILSKRTLLNDFEIRLVSEVSQELSDSDNETFLDQMSKFNDVYREPPLEGVNRVGTNLYWKRFWKIRRDFPLLFDSRNEEDRLASIQVKTAKGSIIDVSFWLVNGAMFSMEFTSKEGIYIPEGSDFSIESVSIFPDKQ